MAGQEDVERVPDLEQGQDAAGELMPSFAKPAKGTRLLERRARRVERDQALADAYADVDARDAGFCRVTGRYTVPGAPDARVRREHHHLEPRSLSRERRADVSNLITVCAEAHQLIEGGFLIVEGTDASKVLRFHWSERAPSARPFHITSKRWSQNDAD